MPVGRESKRRGRRSLGPGLSVAAVAGIFLLAAAAPAASASFEAGAVPASALEAQLGDRNSQSPLLSGDGRFVVFSTNSSVLLGKPANPDEYFSSGVVRKDLATGTVDVVAAPARRSRIDDSVIAPATIEQVAGISDDGRYVLFASTARLVPQVESTVTPEVYVRDMTRPRSDPGSYELVSALDGSSRPAGYSDRLAGSAPGLHGYGLSDDGRRAIFVTQTQSNLPAGGPQLGTPRFQVFVRDLDARTTRLVTRSASDPTLPGTPVPVPPETSAPTALLSGDGSAVAWVGVGAPSQAVFLPGERIATEYMTLLWRDLDAGPTALARRIAGEADPEDPACPPGSAFVPDEVAAGPCYGPFAAPEVITANEQTPPSPLAISDDGSLVFFEGSPRIRPFDIAAARTGVVFAARMTPGVTRKQGVAIAWSQPLTRLPIGASAFAGDGLHAAFASAADRFDGLQPVGRFQSGDLTTQNVFAVDLAARTVERATTAPDGGDYLLASGRETDGPASVSISDDGGAIAFDASDGNLFVGDANDAKDVLIVRRAGDRRSGDVDPARLQPPPPAAERRLVKLPRRYPVIRRLSISAAGVATVLVRAPARGRLTALAKGSTADGGGQIVVGSDRRRVPRARNASLRIVPSGPARRALARASRGLQVRLRIRFAGPGGSATVGQSYVLRGPARGGGPR